MPQRLRPTVVVFLLASVLALAGCRDAAEPHAPVSTPATTSAAAGTTAAAPGDSLAPGPTPAAAATSAMPAIESLLLPDDTLATAKARLGGENVREQALAGAEGETLNGWVLYPDDPKRTVEVFLDETNAHPALLRIAASESVWKRADGIRMGLTSTELQAMNGGPFEFYGFEWDYGGVVGDFRGGRLDPKGAPRGSLTLCPPRDPGEDYPAGDGTFSSDDPRMLATPAVVCEFTVPVGH